MLLIFELTNWLRVRSKNSDISAYMVCCVSKSCPKILVPGRGWSRGWRRPDSQVRRVCTDWAHQTIFTLITVVSWCLEFLKLPIPVSHLQSLRCHGPGVWPGVAGRKLWQILRWFSCANKLGSDYSMLFLCIGFCLGGRWWRVEKNPGLCLGHLLSAHFYLKRVCINSVAPCKLSSVQLPDQTLEIQWWIWFGFTDRFFFNQYIRFYLNDAKKSHQVLKISR